MLKKTMVFLPIIASMVFLGACRRAPHRSGDRTWISNTKAAVLRAEDRGMVDPPLLEAVRDSDPSTRAMAALALGRIGDQAHEAALAGMLQDPAPEVRAAALTGIGLGRFPVEASVLRPLAEDPSGRVREKLAFVLGLLEIPEGIDTLLSLIRDESPKVAEQAALSASALPTRDQAVPVLAKTLDESEDPALVTAAATALATIARTHRREPENQAGAAARDALLEHSGGRSPAMLVQVARGLFPPRNESEKGFLVRLYQHPDRQVRIQALLSLGYPGGPIDPLLDALNGKDFHQKLAALKAMGRNGSRPVLKILRDYSLDNNPSYLRVAAVRAFRRANPEAASFELPRRLVDSPDPDLRSEAARTAAVFQVPGNRAVVARLLADHIPSVRAAAILADAVQDQLLADLLAPVWEETHPEIRRALAQAAGDRLKVRRSGRKIRPEFRDEAYRLLERVWDLSSDDTQELVRSAVLDALETAVPDPAGEALLRKVAGASGYRSRSRAIALLKRIYSVDLPGGSGPAVDHPLEAYAAILRWARTPREAVVTVKRKGFAPGTFTLRLDTAHAPRTCRRFARLAEEGFYNGLVFHRLVPNFLVEGGDPLMNGLGDPGDSIYPETTDLPFRAGTVAMFEGSAAGAGSRFFIALTDQRRLDGRQAAFGRITGDLDGVVRLLIPQDRIVNIRIQEVGAGDTK